MTLPRLRSPDDIMTTHQRPQVNIAFTPDAAEEIVPEARPELWASTPARRVLRIVLLVCLCIGAFTPAIISGEFLPGDDVTVQANPMLYSWDGLSEIWRAPQHLPQVSPVSYSVLLVEHQFAEHQLPEKRAREYRVVGLLIHICNVLLLLLLLRRLELPGAWLAAALFAVHPMQVDTVSWISQQRYLVCALFFLMALLVYLRRAGLNPVPPPPLPGTGAMLNLGLPESQLWLYVLAMTLFVLALLSHIIGATFFLVVLIMIWWERGAVTRADVIPLLPFGIVGALMMFAYSLIMHRHTGGFWEDPVGLRWIALAGQGAWAYLLTIALPFGLSFAYPRWQLDSVPLWKWLLPLSEVFVLAALWVLRTKWGRGPLATALLFLCLLLPAGLGVNDAGGLPGVMVRDHALYFAGAAVLVSIAALLVDWLVSSSVAAKLIGLPGVVPALTAVVLVPLVLLTGSHAAVYRNPQNLWENVLHGDGDSLVALNTMGVLELNRNDYAGAERHFLSALAAAPADTEAQMNLAHVDEQRKDYDKAISRYDQVLATHPDDGNARWGLAADLAAEGQTNEALEEYEHVKALQPRNALIYNNVGLLLSERGDLEAAAEQYKKAIELDPRGTLPYLNLANVQFQQGRADTDPQVQLQKWKDAAETLKRVLQIDPRNLVAYMNGGVMAASVGDLVSADRYFRIAIYLKPDNADAFSNLGMTLLREPEIPGKMDHLGEAIYCFKRATELNPANAGAAQNLQLAEHRRDAFLAAQQR